MNKRMIILYVGAMALIYVTAILLNVNIVTLGYLSIIDALIMILAVSFKPGYAALMAAVPAVLATYTLHYGHYVLAIFLIKGLEGWLISFLGIHKVKPWLSILLVGILVLGLDGLADTIMYGSWSMFMISIGYHALEVTICVITALLLRPVWTKVFTKYFD